VCLLYDEWWASLGNKIESSVIVQIGVTDEPEPEKCKILNYQEAVEVGTTKLVELLGLMSLVLHRIMTHIEKKILLV
jgi:hypothetical protein